LSDVLKNLAGWAYIVVRRPFKPGDRIEIGDFAGDVIDIRVFRFSLLEIRNWVDADQSTGRIVHIPNGMLFTSPNANFTEGFPFIWHEVPVQVTFESDWERAKEIVQAVIDEHAPDPKEAGVVADLEKVSMHYFIRYRHLTPTVYVRALDLGVELTGRLLVPARQRRDHNSAVWTGIPRAFADEPNVEIAYPTIRAYRADQEGKS
jgi:small-conductance mechanosensitive channel